MFEGEDAFLINSSFQGLMSLGSGVRNCRWPCIAPLEIPPFLFPPTRRNALTRRFAGSASTRRRECRRATAGVHSWHIDARVTRRAPRAWGVLARPRGGVRVPRAPSGEYGVLIITLISYHNTNNFIWSQIKVRVTIDLIVVW